MSLRKYWCCEECGSENVFEEAYCNPNSGETWLQDTGEGICEDCDGPCKIIEKERGEG